MWTKHSMLQKKHINQKLTNSQRNRLWRKDVQTIFAEGFTVI